MMLFLISETWYSRYFLFINGGWYFKGFIFNKTYHLSQLLKIQFVTVQAVKTVCRIFLSQIPDMISQWSLENPNWGLTLPICSAKSRAACQNMRMMKKVISWWRMEGWRVNPLILQSDWLLLAQKSTVNRRKPEASYIDEEGFKGSNLLWVVTCC